MKKSLFLILFIGTLPALHAQMWEIGAGVGGLNYKGDVMPKFKPLVVGPGANIFGRMNYSRSLSLKVNALIGQIHGKDDAISDPYHQARGFKFNATIMEAGGQLEYNFMNFRTSASRIINNWTPYVFGGGAYTIYNYSYEKRQLTSRSVYTIDKNGGNNRRNSWILGIGFKKELSPRLNWGVEFGTRWINTDTLDGFGYSNGEYSSTPPDFSGTDPDFAKYNAKMQVPGTKAKDMYYYTNFSISYLFYKVHCPPTRR